MTKTSIIWTGVLVALGVVTLALRASGRISDQASNVTFLMLIIIAVLAGIHAVSSASGKRSRGSR